MNNEQIYKYENIQMLREVANSYRTMADNYDTIANQMEEWYDRYIMAGKLLIEILENMKKEKGKEQCQDT